MSEVYSKNLTVLSEQLRQLISQAEPLGTLQPAKKQGFSLCIDGIYFHSRHDPIKEANRLIADLKAETSEQKKLFIFLGGGLGYSILSALQSKKCHAIWLERNPGILKQALHILDFSSFLQDNRLQLLVGDFGEEQMFTAFKGTAQYSVTFITHRASVSWHEKQYLELKFLCEQFFHKKDVNVATLSKFEKSWTRNILHNLAELTKMAPMSLLFGLAKDLPVLVVAAGPSLYETLPDIHKYRHCFVLIAVDTALAVLAGANIEPDLIYSVDPQAINSNYLQSYQGRAVLAFDPTSTYHTLRLNKNLRGFFSASPFPLLRLITENMTVYPGDIPFGGSVSTNAISLAELMEASHCYLTGQDLAFTDGFAHSKGAVLEERLNFKESRYFRRELHNHRQLSALTKIPIAGYAGQNYITNEKMQIFRKWFEEQAEQKNWINLTKKGGIIDRIPRSDFAQCFGSLTPANHQKIQSVRQKIQELANIPAGHYLAIDALQQEIRHLIEQLEPFRSLLKKGKILTEQIYQMIKKKKNQSGQFSRLLQQMERIDEQVSAKKGLSEILALSMQRIIYSITEGYENALTVEEKLNPHLAIAKKSVLLYQGLLDSCQLHLKLLKKSLFRLEND